MKQITLLLIVILLSGCKLAYRTLLGVDMTPSLYHADDINELFEKRNVPDSQAYVMKLNSYFEALQYRSQKQVDQLEIDGIVSREDTLMIEKIKENLKYDTNPVQVRYFEKSGKPIFKMVGCKVEPPISMNWNVEGCFDVFPPQPIPEMKEDYKDSLQFFLTHIESVNGDPVSMDALPQADFYAVVFWNTVLIRSSRTLINQIRAYDQSFPEQNTFFLFVNNHRALYWSGANEEQQQQIEEAEENVKKR